MPGVAYAAHGVQSAAARPRRAAGFRALRAASLEKPAEGEGLARRVEERALERLVTEFFARPKSLSPEAMR
jgi:hypothetical protein